MKITIISYINFETNTLSVIMPTSSEKINTDEYFYAGIILFMKHKKTRQFELAGFGRRFNDHRYQD